MYRLSRQNRTKVKARLFPMVIYVIDILVLMMNYCRQLRRQLRMSLMVRVRRMTLMVMMMLVAKVLVTAIMTFLRKIEMKLARCIISRNAEMLEHCFC